MFRTYKSELIDRQITVNDDNEIKERKNVANWLVDHASCDIRKYLLTWKTPNTVKEVFDKIKEIIEIKLPPHQRVSTWEEFIDKITDIKLGRPITKLEDVAISYMKKRSTSRELENCVEIIGNTDDKYSESFDTASKMTQFIYFGSNDETNTEIGIVKTIFSNDRDQKFEQEWYQRNEKARLFCIKNEFKVPFADMKVWESRDHVYPKKRKFIDYVNSIEIDKSTEKIKKYIEIAVKQMDEYFELDDDDKKMTITHKYIHYMKKFMDTTDEKIAIHELKKEIKITPSSVGKRKYSDTDSDNDTEKEYKKRNISIRKNSNITDPKMLDYTKDMESLENNRNKWNHKKTKGYKILQETNNNFAPYGYNEDFSERIAPHGFVDNDSNNRARIKGSMWNK